MLVRPAIREYRTWTVDSRRWQTYEPREGDIVVVTYPKCGTTWMQRIVNMLVFQSADVRPVSKMSPWYDSRGGAPVSELNESLGAQRFRRAMKSHVPFDGLPVYDEVRYIHVARDGRDACLSYHNHASGFTQETLNRLDKTGMEDASIGQPFPRIPADPADYFHLWLTQSRLHGFTDGYLGLSYFEFEKTYWSERSRSNLLLVHFGDLTHDLEGEMRRIAEFLDIEIEPQLWRRLVASASFETMKSQGDQLMPTLMNLFDAGKDRFFHRGQNGLWKGKFRIEDLALYDQIAITRFPPELADWLERGRLCHSDGKVRAEPPTTNAQSNGVRQGRRPPSLPR